jgi:ubiquitin-conjugating enzyme E2 O
LLFFYEAHASPISFRYARSEHGLVPTIHANGKIKVGAMIVRETQTSVVVKWQDDSVTTERTTELLPHINIDEYDCW